LIVFGVEDDEMVAEVFGPHWFGPYCGMVNKDFGLWELGLYDRTVIEDPGPRGCGLHGGVSVLVRARPPCLWAGGGIWGWAALLLSPPCLQDVPGVFLGENNAASPFVSSPIWHLPSHPSEMNGGVSL
jgi:hypothetical protein